MSATDDRLCEKRDAKFCVTILLCLQNPPKTEIIIAPSEDLWVRFDVHLDGENTIAQNKPN